MPHKSFFHPDHFGTVFQQYYCVGTGMIFYLPDKSKVAKQNFIFKILENARLFTKEMLFSYLKKNHLYYYYVLKLGY